MHLRCFCVQQCLELNSVDEGLCAIIASFLSSALSGPELPRPWGGRAAEAGVQGLLLRDLHGRAPLPAAPSPLCAVDDLLPHPTAQASAQGEQCPAGGMLVQLCRGRTVSALAMAGNWLSFTLPVRPVPSMSSVVSSSCMVLWCFGAGQTCVLWQCSTISLCAGSLPCEGLTRALPSDPPCC